MTAKNCYWCSISSVWGNLGTFQISLHFLGFWTGGGKTSRSHTHAAMAYYANLTPAQPKTVEDRGGRLEGGGARGGRESAIPPQTATVSWSWFKQLHKACKHTMTQFRNKDFFGVHTLNPKLFFFLRFWKVNCLNLISILSYWYPFPFWRHFFHGSKQINTKFFLSKTLKWTVALTCTSPTRTFFSISASQCDWMNSKKRKKNQSHKTNPCRPRRHSDYNPDQ